MSNAYYQLPGGRVAALNIDSPFPAPERALAEPNGLLAIGGDLSAERLLNAYRQGIFPWFSEGEPVLWWSPNPRMVLFPEELKVSRSLEKRLRKPDYEVRYNTCFLQVMRRCAEIPRAHQDGTWITEEIVAGYHALHQMGHAMSAETWMEGELVGGLYGVRLGGMFYGESMFHARTDASKIAFVHLVRDLQRQGVRMIDCQMKTAHLASLGAREIPRAEFLSRLTGLIDDAA